MFLGPRVISRFGLAPVREPKGMSGGLVFCALWGGEYGEGILYLYNCLSMACLSAIYGLCAPVSSRSRQDNGSIYNIK
ncbi:hypothetical protein BJX65DRAFT_286479 [Aspergillus insuetus]